MDREEVAQAGLWRPADGTCPGARAGRGKSGRRGGPIRTGPAGRPHTGGKPGPHTPESGPFGSLTLWPLPLTSATPRLELGGGRELWSAYTGTAGRAGTLGRAVGFEGRARKPAVCRGPLRQLSQEGLAQPPPGLAGLGLSPGVLGPTRESEAWEAGPSPPGPAGQLVIGHSHPRAAQRPRHRSRGPEAALGGPQNSVPSEKVTGPDLCPRLWKTGLCRSSEAGTEDSRGEDSRFIHSAQSTHVGGRGVQGLGRGPGNTV